MPKGTQFTVIEGNVMSCVRMAHRQRPIAIKLEPAPAVINLIRPSSMENYSEYFRRDTLRPCHEKHGAALLTRSASHHLTQA